MADSVVVASGLDADLFTFSLDNLDDESFQNSNTFYQLASGNYNVFIKDTSGCLGSQKIFIQSPDPIEVQLEERFLFTTNIDDDLSENLPFSSSFQSSGWGGDPTTTFINAELAVVNDGSNLPDLGCNSLINTEEIAGKIALVRRGECEFGLKALRAQEAGASEVIIINNEPGTITMGGGANGASVNIPVFMVGNQEGNDLTDMLETAENLSFSIGQYIPLNMETCEGRSDGFARPLVTGGVGPYTYEWNNGNTQLSLENVPSGSYTLSITDANNCATIWELDIPLAPTPQPNFRIINEFCAGEADGNIRILNASILNQFDVSFSNGATGIMAANLQPGNYAVVFTSDAGCEHTREISIEAGADIADPIIYGPTEVVPSSTVFYATKTRDEVTFEWFIEGGEILSGQGTDLVEILIDDSTLDPVITLAVTQDECTKTESKTLDAVSTSTRDWQEHVSFKTYPNPTAGSIFVEFGHEVLSSDQHPIQILNINGQVLIQKPFQQKQEIILDNLAPGLYIIKAGPYSDKLIKW